MRIRSVSQWARVLAALLIRAAACSGDDEDTVAPSTTSAPAGPPTFTMVELVAEANGPAGVRPIDLDGDGQDELIVSEFGERPDDAGPTEFPPGWLSTYWREGDGLVADDTVTWRREVIFDDQEGLYFPNDVTAEDLDGDGDGLLDIVTVGEEQEDAEVVWFRAVEPGVFEPDAIVIGSGGGSLPVAHDVDGDGDLDVGSAEYFYPGASYVWFGNTTADPTEAWTHRPISEGIGSRPTEGVAFQAPGVFGHGDIDGDGDVDIAVSGDGDDRVFWLEQTAPGTFANPRVGHRLRSGRGRCCGRPGRRRASRGPLHQL